jgi:hypothetical protein
MPIVHTRYVEYARSRHRRHSMSVAVDLIPPLTNGPTSHYEDSAPPEFPVSSTSGHRTSVTFAFWSVTGAARQEDGRDTAFVQAGDRLLDLRVGSTDVHATAWYLPAGGGPEDEPLGVVIDAFDVNAGGFVDDDFVSVHPDDGLTFAANDDGFVPSASPEHVMAYPALPASGRPFEDWIVVEGTETVANEDLAVAAGSSATAFAFYHSFLALPPGRVDLVPETRQILDWLELVDGGLNPYPWGSMLRQFTAGLQLARIARGLAHELQAPVLELAAKQITLSAQAIAEHLQKPLTPPPGIPPKG